MTESVIDQIDSAERAESDRKGTGHHQRRKRKASEDLRKKEMDKQVKRMEDSFNAILLCCGVFFYTLPHTTQHEVVRTPSTHNMQLSCCSSLMSNFYVL